MNESLRRAMLRARLREDDVAAHLGVDPKTVRRWLSGRVPYPSSRAALADLVGRDEAELWPEAGGLLSRRSRPEELAAVYPHRWAIPRDVWTHFFESAERRDRTSLLTAPCSSPKTLGCSASSQRRHATACEYGSRSAIRIACAVAQRGQEEGIGDAMAAKVRNALMLYRQLTQSENVEIRLHQTALYNSIYRVDGQIFVNQHVYGIPAAQSPVYHFRRTEDGDITNAHLDSFERIWTHAQPA